jgi:hypothetical protein
MASAVTKEAIARVAKEIFGRVSGIQMYGKANGQRFLKQELTGVYLDRYYPESIEKAARTVSILLGGRSNSSTSSFVIIFYNINCLDLTLPFLCCFCWCFFFLAYFPLFNFYLLFIQPHL